jgi:hypothetical protein
MPLNSDNESARCVFDGLDDTVGRKRNRTEIAPRILHGLMMIAVDLDLGSPRNPGNEAVLGDLDDMARGRLAILLIMSLVMPD